MRTEHTPGPWTSDDGNTLNAKLIAAAPDLLAALKAVLSALDRESGRTEHWLKKEREQARSAISAAESE